VEKLKSHEFLVSMSRPALPWEKAYASYCTSSARCATIPAASRRFDSLTPHGFARRTIARVLVQAVVLAVVSVAANPPLPVPDLDPLRIESERLGHFLDGRHSCFTKTIVSWRELIAPLDAGHDARGERLAFSGLHALAV
jgi:hypothetical protein